MNKLKTILFWADGVLDSEFNEIELYKDLELTTLNSIVNDGCVGQLLYSDKSTETSTTTTHDKNSTSELQELLGFEYNDDKISEALFKEKYMDLDIKFITNVDTEYSIFQDTVKLEENVDLVNIINNCTKDMIIIHYKSKSTNLQDRKKSLKYLESTMSSLVSLSSTDADKLINNRFYINIIIGYNKTNVEIPLNQQQSLNTIPSWFQSPKQSFTLSNSIQVNPRLTSPLFTIHYNSILTRKDNSKSFCETEFINGSNGKILLFQHFRELAFKLGKVPKYGA